MNIAEILKNVPSGTKLYSPLYGDVKLAHIDNGEDYPICIWFMQNDGTECLALLTAEGYANISCTKNARCMLYPSKFDHNWIRFAEEMKKLKESTFKPFDKVLVKFGDLKGNVWFADFFSHYSNDKDYPYVCVGGKYKYCIPYNEETAKLIGTNGKREEDE